MFQVTEDLYQLIKYCGEDNPKVKDSSSGDAGSGPGSSTSKDFQHGCDDYDRNKQHGTGEKVGIK